jgi:hypothetical protein
MKNKGGLRMAEKDNTKIGFEKLFLNGML